MSLPLSALEALPPADGRAADALLAAEFARLAPRLAVLDDDPTGVQTVHGVHVYTGWEAEELRRGLEEQARLFFVLTNSRSFSPGETERAHREIGRNLAAAARRAGRDFVPVSRGDSTLRGHWPLETETLRRALEGEGLGPYDGEIIVPFFPEGGRYTLGNVHYVREGEALIPAGETEFARDADFGYRASDLPQWCEEKSGGRVRAADVACIPLEWLRALDAEAVARTLRGVRGFGKVVVNAADYADVAVFCAGLLRAMGAGERFVLRTAAALPKVLGGVPGAPLLGRADMLAGRGAAGGLVVVGSHVNKTTRQLEALLEGLPELRPVCFDAGACLRPGGLEAEGARVRAAAETALRRGETAVVYTSRAVLGELADSVRISHALTGVVRGLAQRPAFLVAKGGITSSDVGVNGLGVRRALVLGQAAPGVPVWRTETGSRFPGMPYVIFPGNVGEDDTLLRVVSTLLGR